MCISPYEKQEYPITEFGECRFKKIYISRKRREQGILNAAGCGGRVSRIEKCPQRSG